MIASSALVLSAWRKEAPFSSSDELSAASVSSSPAEIACWPDAEAVGDFAGAGDQGFVELAGALAESRVELFGVGVERRCAGLEFRQQRLAALVELDIEHFQTGVELVGEFAAGCFQRCDSASVRPERTCSRSRLVASVRSCRLAARVSINCAKASPDVEIRLAISSLAVVSSSLSCSWAPAMEARMRSAWLTMASRSEPSS
jgi:hypothetical protein